MFTYFFTISETSRLDASKDAIAKPVKLEILFAVASSSMLDTYFFLGLAFFVLFSLAKFWSCVTPCYP